MPSKTIAIIGKQNHLAPYRLMFFALVRIFGYSVILFDKIELAMVYGNVIHLSLLVVFADTSNSAKYDKFYKNWKNHPLALWICLGDQKVDMPDVKALPSKSSPSFMVCHVDLLYAQSLPK